MKKTSQRAPHRSLFKAMGITDEELKRPIIGIANSENEVIPGHIHLGEVAAAVKAGIRMAGGTPLEFSTIGICAYFILCFLIWKASVVPGIFTHLFSRP